MYYCTYAKAIHANTVISFLSLLVVHLVSINLAMQHQALVLELYRAGLRHLGGPGATFSCGALLTPVPSSSLFALCKYHVTSKYPLGTERTVDYTWQLHYI